MACDPFCCNGNDVRAAGGSPDGGGEYAYTWTPPADRDDGLQTATPAEVGIDPAASAIVELIREHLGPGLR